MVRDGCEKRRQGCLEEGAGAGRQDFAVLDDLAQQLFHLGISLLVEGSFDHVFGTVIDVLDLELSGGAKRPCQHHEPSERHRDAADHHVGDGHCSLAHGQHTGIDCFYACGLKKAAKAEKRT